MPLYFLHPESLQFPPAHLADEEGLLAIGGDLSIERLLIAYSKGIFPWFNEGDPILWWSPDPRLILLPDCFHLSRRMARTIRHSPYHTTFDTAFEQVIHECARIPREAQDGTWITENMINAYTALHEEGFAHSVETWNNDTLIGGLYGVSIGKCFFGESMFSRQPNASKIALATLVDQARQWEFLFIDCQVTTEHLITLGACEIDRPRFLRLIEKGIKTPTHRGKWTTPAPTPSSKIPFTTNE